MLSYLKAMQIYVTKKLNTTAKMDCNIILTQVKNLCNKPNSNVTNERPKIRVATPKCHYPTTLDPMVETLSSTSE